MIDFKGKILAVDFDNTLVFTDCSKGQGYESLIMPNYKVVKFVKYFKKNGGRIILNTCRHDEALDVAVKYCKFTLGIEFDKVNENLDEEIEKFGDCRKIFAHYYLDDKAMKIEDIDSYDC